MGNRTSRAGCPPSLASAKARLKQRSRPIFEAPLEGFPKRWLRRGFQILGLIWLSSVSLPADAQFNPSGRKRPPPTTKQPAQRKPQQREPKETKVDSAKLIERYTNIVMKQPGAQFPLQRLAQLYRERDGNLEKLIQQLEKRASSDSAQAANARIALAGIYRQDGQFDRAVQTYEAIIAEDPKGIVAVVALAQLLQDRGDKDGAFRYFQRALPRIREASELEQTLRTLMGLALDLNKLSEAKGFHKTLVERAKGSFFIRSELGRELMLRGKYAQAVAEFEDVVKHASGDNRVLAPALRDLGQAQAKAKQTKQALATLKRALGAAGAQAGVRREIYDIIVDVYRAENNLAELVKLVEAEPQKDFYQAKMLGALYEETGQIPKALSAYRAALAKKANDIETRQKVVQLLQIQGELDLAIKEYELLIRAAPRNPDFVFHFAEALIQRGDRSAALGHLKKLEARSSGDEDTLAALVDFYERMEESELAMAVLQKLARDPRDPRHLVDLGARHFQEGNTEKAIQTWQRILNIVPNKARAQFTLGEVYLEHELTERALKSFEEAVKLAPQVTNYKKGYALALERSSIGLPANLKRKQLSEALKLWEELLKEASAPHLAREARQHIVSIWNASGQLEGMISPLARRLAASPPDLESGRTLAEIYVRRKRYPEAEKTLTQIVAAAPGDSESLLRLEHVQVVQRKLKDAINTLKKLVQVEPSRAREYYQRMANYSAELYLDADAIEFAAKAVELSPDDAEGHRRLGEMYRKSQDNERAITQFRQAIAKNDRLFSVYFQLAELLMTKGEVEEADQLLRRVVRASTDEELVSQAARLSMQLNLARNQLEALELELLPASLGNPGKPIYRRLLIELYGAMAFPLAHQVKSGKPEEAKLAMVQLAKLGERAVKPLLDALSDDNDSQQLTALELLSHVNNRGTGPALIAFATGSAEPRLRAQAMQIIASFRDPALLPKLSEIIAPGNLARADESDPVLTAAAWAVAHMQDPKARPLLLKMLESDAPSVKALAALGLSATGQPADIGKLSATAAALDAGPLPRAAAAYALGKLGAKAPQATLLPLLSATDPLVKGHAMQALAHLKEPRVKATIASAWFSHIPEDQRAARNAALLLAGSAYPDALNTSRNSSIELLNLRQLLGSLVPASSPELAAQAIAELTPELTKSLAQLSSAEPARVHLISQALLNSTPEGAPSGAQFPSSLFGYDGNFNALSAQEQSQLSSNIELLSQAALGPFLKLSEHPSASVRVQALHFLSTREEPEARAALVARLQDKEESVQLTSLTSLGASGELATPATAVSVSELLSPSYSWTLRARAAEVLSKLGALANVKEVVEALARSAEQDSMALVREASLSALGRVDSNRARQLASSLVKSDVEPRVREVAKKLL